MRNVITVVAVLMINCHVSEKWKAGPVTSQITITRTAPQKAHALPSKMDERCAKDRNASLTAQKISRSSPFFVFFAARALLAMSLNLSHVAASLRALLTCSSNGQAQSGL